MKMRHHFAHRPDVSCNPETALHRTAKILLCEEIEHAIAEQREVTVSWECSRCGSGHRGNLLKKARSVCLEHSFTTCRPDLTLFDEHARPVAIIGVVVSHAPEDHVRDFCTQEKIGMLEYHITDDSSLDTLRPLTKLDAKVGSVCTRSKCPKCKAPLFDVEIHVVDGECWKCRAAMKIAFGYGEGGMAGPGEFNAHAVSVARQHGAILRERFSNVVKERYLANTCQRCGNFCGEFYLHDFWYLAEESTKLFAGYECLECDWECGP